MEEIIHNKKFDQKSANVHERLKHHKCESCSKSFSRTEHLKRHIHTVHEGQKHHKCESCGKSFSEARSLKKHIHRIHEL